MSVTAVPAQKRAAFEGVSRDEWLMRGGIALLVVWLLLIIALPPESLRVFAK